MYLTSVFKDKEIQKYHCLSSYSSLLCWVATIHAGHSKLKRPPEKISSQKGYVKNQPKAGYVVEMKCTASIQSVVYAIPELQQPHSCGYNLQISTR